ncbi:hypothetical protein [Cyclobacterium marinum]|uniref:Lipoprotein n=1 Tax=Cyclobacterium marinum (strain ATCC 25205 / DSM 745 / LMG 13164 / NCIMB 1802) TaxID=880070 RepID=G0IYS3_CYCMS|nr:hypothetical protein [Cyclobacterium marinum]AEL27256.1 hypothetical protein Cycma_3536 [Cyclobacterium marinum DSM 745]
MKIKTYLFPILVIALFSGSCNLFQSNSGQYELVVLDTLNIPFSGDIHAGTYAHNTGLIYNYQSGEYLKFDSLGNVLANKIIPTVGDSGLYYVNGLKIIENGNILAKSIKGEIGLLDEELNLVKKANMPFPNGSLDLKRNQNAINVYKDELLLFHPGRNNKSPYELGYYRDNYLLEKLNPSTGVATPFLKLSPKSQYQESLHFEPPTALISISDNSLYFVFNKEPLISKYDLSNNGEWVNSIPLDSEDFVQVKGQKLPLGNDGSVLVEGEITNLFALKNGFAVVYIDGLLKEPGPGQKIPGKQLKIYNYETGWSAPIELPFNLLFLLNFEQENKAFYGLINPKTLPIDNNQAQVLKYQLASH